VGQCPERKLFLSFGKKKVDTTTSKSAEGTAMPRINCCSEKAFATAWGSRVGNVKGGVIGKEPKTPEAQVVKDRGCWRGAEGGERDAWGEDGGVLRKPGSEKKAKHSRTKGEYQFPDRLRGIRLEPYPGGENNRAGNSERRSKTKV